jgi:hypothetical protein
MKHMTITMTKDEHRLLDMLADHSAGCTERLLMAHGFRLKLIAELVGQRFATATTERVITAGQAIDTTRIRITDAGRTALSGPLVLRRRR